jgi:hypothetical protein
VKVLPCTSEPFSQFPNGIGKTRPYGGALETDGEHGPLLDVIGGQLGKTRIFILTTGHLS